ncbi:hypothetical protein Q1695_000546 [Nippostrongylus brasiliensis]|nr:hypothetical protein Q1695_000546 [Nippostrongylus brasiliensis]
MLTVLLLHSLLVLGTSNNSEHHSTTKGNNAKNSAVLTAQSTAKRLTSSTGNESTTTTTAYADVGPDATEEKVSTEGILNELLAYSLLSNHSHSLHVPHQNGMSSSKSVATRVEKTVPVRFPADPPNGLLMGMPIEDSSYENQLNRALQIKSLADGTEERLYRTLLSPDRYERDVRPTTHHSRPTNVTFGFLLNQIVEMDERNQVLTTRSWLNINWMDQRLVWNYSEWEDIKTIYIPHQRLWKPDIILVNNAVREYHASLVSTDIMVTSNGNVTWLFSALFRSSCPIRVRYYPFDDQECDLKFASWSHDASEIDLGLNTDKGDLSSYMNNSEFDLLDMIAMKEAVSFPSNPSSKWPTIVIRIKMHRRPLFYIFNHIVPCVLISSMAVLGFLMPPETGEKINMIITTLLSMGVYLQSITESIPPTSEAVPLIGMYYVSSLFMVCLATCVNVITLNMHRNGAANQGRHVPCWMEKWVLGYLASLMRMSIREPDSIALLKTAQSKKSTIRRSSILRDLKRIKNYDHRKGDRQRLSECECISQFNNINEIAIMTPICTNGATGSTRREYVESESAFLGRMAGEQILPRINITRTAMVSEFEQRFRRILKRIYRSLQQHEIREEVIDERLRIQWQWQQLASVVDRLLLVLFSLATLLTITFFLLLPVGLRDEEILRSPQ